MGSRSQIVISVLGLFFCIVLHELGHSLVAQRFGYPVRDITLYPIGGVAAIEGSPRPRHELLIALAGPAVNVVIAGLLIAILAPQHKLPHWSWPPWASQQNVQLLETSPIAFLLIANISVVLFNMIPAFPMDGGRVLRAVLGLLIGKSRATRIAAAIGQFLAILMGLYGAGIIGGRPNYGLVIISLFVYFGAGQERRLETTNIILDDIPVSDAMVTEFETLQVGDTLQHAADHLIATNQQDFPVLVGESEVVGVLSRAQLLRGLAQHGPTAYVAGEMTRDPLIARDDAAVEEYMLRDDGVQSAPVLVKNAEGKLVGMLTQENLLEFLTVRQLAADD